MFGRPEAAAKAALHIVMAGEDAVLARLEPVFAALGRSWRMGTRPVHANLTKLSGNFMIGCAIETMAEAAALLGAHGADARAFLAFMSETLLASPIYKSYGATIGSGQEPVTSIGLSLPLKDMGLILSAGHGAGLRIPLASLLLDALQQARAQGLEKKDWSVALAEVARTRTGPSTSPATP
jgi:3-hydroxyisobutyrate dehydrogenase-like beta-hydroxyacid dehydrogenase